MATLLLTLSIGSLVRANPLLVREPSNELQTNLEPHPHQEARIQQPHADATKSTTDSEQRDLIVGGTLATVGEFPWFVSTTGGGYCGASLIAPSVVLTAAHCDGLFNPGRTLLVGPTKRDSTFGGALIRTVTRRIVHPLYDDDSLAYDLMLVQINNPVTTIEPLEWNTNSSVPEAGGTNVTVMGFGRTEYETGPVSQDVLRVDLETVADNVCLNRYGANNLQTNIMMCARYPPSGDPKSACQGDSGGPMITMATREDGSKYPLQLGVVSWGVGCGHAFYPGVYARPSGAVEWMKKTICTLSPDCTEPVLETTNPPTPSPVAATTPTLQVTFSYDDQPGETEWDIILVRPSGAQVVIYTGPTYNPLGGQTWTSSFDDFPTGNYLFRVRDANGLKSGAGFQIILENAANPDGVLLASGPSGPFSGFTTTPFQVASATPAPTPVPTPSPTSFPTSAPTLPPIGSSAGTQASPTSMPTQERSCVCLAGPLGCLSHLCDAHEDDQDQCEDLGCTWRPQASTGSTPPPNVEDPDDSNDGTTIIEEEEESDLKKAGMSAVVGLAAAIATFCVLAVCSAFWCGCSNNRDLEVDQLPSTRQPAQPSKSRARGDIAIQRTSTESEDSELGY
eukprot:CAMPEP_0172472392 /NCGR_PEP_ID=MMETSP1065-20121228/68310_1 /TAXON_ID=265537 /ORGANISM="Amphiprora paludosa, Strain CCMP125" /LENGTH=620 /DNA_ID=CAMNT_0013230527 /DNA_START=171 /DNA_END=2033 /DNA_ORIENTATION=-